MPETIKGLWHQRLRWAQGGVEVIVQHAGGLLKWRQRHMWPVFIEFCLSLIWSYCILVLGISVFIDQIMDIPALPSLSEWLPSWGGAIIGVTCLTQFGISLLIDSRFERGISRYYFWIIWYPIAYWLLNVFTSIVAVPKTLLRGHKQRAVWVSPDRV